MPFQSHCAVRGIHDTDPSPHPMKRHRRNPIKDDATCRLAAILMGGLQVVECPAASEFQPLFTYQFNAVREVLRFPRLTEYTKPMVRIMKLPALSWLILSLIGGCVAARAEAGRESPYPLIDDARVCEVRDLTFGMWICWSFSTFTGQEYSKGVKRVDWFNPTGFNPDQWCQTAKEAGMKYILLLTKHHDGFCLWDTATTDRKVTKAPLGKDVVAEVRKACLRHELKLALYFSEPDWSWPNNQDPQRKKQQLEELLTRYGPIEFLWMDTGGIGDGGLNHTETMRWIRKLQPRCAVGFSAMDPQGEIRIGELAAPGPLSDLKAAGWLWEAYTNYTHFSIHEFGYPIIGGREIRRWFYTAPECDELVYPAESIYRDYEGARKHGNLFNLAVAPDRAGRLREIDVKTLKKVGQYIRGELRLPMTQVSHVKATASSIYENDLAGHAPALLFDGRDDTGWGPLVSERTGWVEFELEAPTKVARVVIDEGKLDRIRRFELKARQSEGTWLTLVQGDRIGPRHEYKFPAVTAQVFRLEITEAVQCPGLWEIQWFER